MPLPIWSEKATQSIYALVAYNHDCIVSDFGTGYFVEEIIDFRDDQRREAVARGLRYEVGSTILKELEPDSECLFAPKAATEAVLSAEPKSGACTIYLAGSGVRVRLFVDGDIYTSRSGALNRDFLAVSVLPGKHEIKVTHSIGMGGIRL